MVKARELNLGTFAKERAAALLGDYAQWIRDEKHTHHYYGYNPITSEYSQWDHQTTSFGVTTDYYSDNTAGSLVQLLFRKFRKEYKDIGTCPKYVPIKDRPALYRKRSSEAMKCLDELMERSNYKITMMTREQLKPFVDKIRETFRHPDFDRIDKEREELRKKWWDIYLEMREECWKIQDAVTIGAEKKPSKAFLEFEKRWKEKLDES